MLSTPSTSKFLSRPAPVLRSGVALLAMLGAIGILAPFHAHAADDAGMNAARQTYEQERARCMSAPPNVDRAACLTSAGAAFEEARRGRLDVAPHPYEANKTSRCDPLPPEERKECMLRMNGAGTASGSVSEGGIVRELVTVEPAAPPPR